MLDCHKAFEEEAGYDLKKKAEKNQKIDLADDKLMDKRKILFIVEAMGGGVFTYMVALANELAEQYEMYVAYALRRQTPENYRDYYDKRVHLIEVKNFSRAVNLTKDIKAFFEIIRIAKEIKPDIIHLHSSKAGAIGRIAFNGRKIPVFYTPHGYSFLMLNQSLGRRIIYRAVERLLSRRKCMTISCSEGEHQESLKLTKNAVCVNNGINVAELQGLIESTDSIQDSPFTVFTLGRICYQKNPALFNRVAEAMPDIRFLWIGDGELREELIAPNIEVTGWVKREEALKYSLGGNIFLLTSLWEGLPISLLESMYMKKMCVVSDVIGNHDVIHNGDNGFVCECVDDYVAAIRSAVQHPEYIEKAYLDVLNKYNTEVMAKGYSDIYMSKLSVSGGYSMM